MVAALKRLRYLYGYEVHFGEFIRDVPDRDGRPLLAGFEPFHCCKESETR